MGKKSKHRRRAGRPADLNAKRRQTTRAGQGRDIRPTPELIAHRLRVSGNPDVSTDFPLDILAARRQITRDQYDAGWWLLAVRARAGFMSPYCKVEALYGRMASFGWGPPPLPPPELWTDAQKAAQKRAVDEWHDAWRMLGQVSLDARLAVQQVVVDLLLYTNIDDLRAGLDALAEARSKKGRRAA